MSQKKYRLMYKLSCGEFTKEYITEKDQQEGIPNKIGIGGCDALVLVSIIRDAQPHNGAKSFARISVDGYTGEACPDTEVFQAFSAMAEALSESSNIPEWQKEIATDVFRKIKNKIINYEHETEY